MGLDQYAFTGENKRTGNEIAYWRKHNRLQGFMENLWIEKGRPDEHKECLGDFNCITLELKLDDIERLNEAVITDSLPVTEGFFFGSDSQGNDWHKEQTIEFIASAREAFKAGHKVFYNSNW